ncbi:hypothetical protein N0V83_006320 [Neocucurbitaria cava]|uniref:Uncharacterized protein n=1 Tax=Neocucurbitaria cava TaxID=798079 RepID=A0A9W8Y9T1_9PLEO|nr:hypothetical protein N0V83_006320 [Neocucurbitaria cava]
MNERREIAFSPRKIIGKTRQHLRTPATFKDSVDETNPVEIDYKANPWWRSRYLCWEVKGQIAEEYKILGPKIYDELRQSCRESSLEIFIWPYMLGKSTKSARPVLVIASEDEASRADAKATIERSDILKEHQHFKLWPLRYLPTGPVSPVAMEDHATAQPLPSTESFEVYYDPAERLRPIGMPIYIKHSGTTVRRATANAVHNGTNYGYMTAAHAFVEAVPQRAASKDSSSHFDFPFDSDSDSESSNNMDIDASSLYSGTSPETIGRGSSSTASSQRSETSSQTPSSLGDVEELGHIENLNFGDVDYSPVEATTPPKARGQLTSDKPQVDLKSSKIGSRSQPSRSIGSFLSSDKYDVMMEREYSIPIVFGFGPGLKMSVYGLQGMNANALCHKHIIYAWPPDSTKDTHTYVHAVLPAVLTPDVEANLQDAMDTHLLDLVTHHFHAFPLYTSPLKVLREVYVFFRSLETDSAHSLLLTKALKLLVLVHVGGDIVLLNPATDAATDELVRATMPATSLPITPTPCFIRAQFGTAIPALAVRLITEILSSLEQFLPRRSEHDWPAVLATLLVVLMTIESIQYHAAQRPYHEDATAVVARSAIEEGSNRDEEAVQLLLDFYFACFSGCHTRLHPQWAGEPKDSPGPTPELKFIKNIRGAINNMDIRIYLDKKAVERQWDGVDMNFFFDRLVARLFVAKS